jgi:hypothetical protein
VAAYVSNWLPFFSPYGGYLVFAVVLASLGEVVVITQFFAQRESRSRIRAFLYPLLVITPYLVFGVRPAAAKISSLLLSLLLLSFAVFVFPLLSSFASPYFSFPPSAPSASSLPRLSHARARLHP